MSLRSAVIFIFWHHWLGGKAVWHWHLYWRTHQSVVVACRAARLFLATKDLWKLALLKFWGDSRRLEASSIFLLQLRLLLLELQSACYACCRWRLGSCLSVAMLALRGKGLVQLDVKGYNLSRCHISGWRYGCQNKFIEALLLSINALKQIHRYLRTCVNFNLSELLDCGSGTERVFLVQVLVSRCDSIRECTTDWLRWR